MGGTFADEGHATVLASFIEARHSLVVGEVPPALGTQTGSAGAHTAATLPASTATLTTTAAALSTSTTGSLAAASSLPFHLILPVGRRLPDMSLVVTVATAATRTVAVSVSAVVEAVVVA